MLIWLVKENSEMNPAWLIFFFWRWHLYPEENLIQTKTRCWQFCVIFVLHAICQNLNVIHVSGKFCILWFNIWIFIWPMKKYLVVHYKKLYFLNTSYLDLIYHLRLLTYDDDINQSMCTYATFMPPWRIMLMFKWC